MKVHIGKYKKYIGVYQLTEWLPEYTQEKFCNSKFGDTLDSLCTWVHSKRTRKEKVTLPYKGVVTTILSNYIYYKNLFSLDKF